MSVLTDTIASVQQKIAAIETKYQDLASCVTAGCNARDLLNTLLTTKTTQLNDLAGQLQAKINTDQLNLNAHINGQHIDEVVNLLPNAGSLVKKEEYLFGSDPVFDPAPLLSTRNGATITKYGHFINNNSTNGGTGAALLPGIAAMTTAKSGSQWNAALITAGTGTYGATMVDGQVYYGAILPQYVFFTGSKSTLGYGVYAIDNTVVRTNNGNMLIPAGGYRWINYKNTNGLDYHPYPYISLQPGGKCVIGKMVLTPGLVDIPDRNNLYPSLF